MRKGTLKKALALALTGAVLVGAFAGCGAKTKRLGMPLR